MSRRRCCLPATGGPGPHDLRGVIAGGGPINTRALGVEDAYAPGAGIDRLIGDEDELDGWFLEARPVGGDDLLQLCMRKRRTRGQHDRGERDAEQHSDDRDAAVERGRRDRGQSDAPGKVRHP